QSARSSQPAALGPRVRGVRRIPTAPRLPDQGGRRAAPGRAPGGAGPPRATSGGCPGEPGHLAARGAGPRRAVAAPHGRTPRAGPPACAFHSFRPLRLTPTVARISAASRATLRPAPRLCSAQDGRIGAVARNQLNAPSRLTDDVTWVTSVNVLTAGSCARHPIAPMGVLLDHHADRVSV